MGFIERTDMVRGLKRSIFVLLSVYGAVLTVVVLRDRPKTIIIGVDSTGTKILTDSNEKLLQGETLAFLREFILLQYRYSSETYQEQVSRSGDFVSDPLWKQKQKEWAELVEKLKAREIIQNASITSITQVDHDKYEAHLSVSVQEKLATSRLKLKVTLETEAAARTRDNPYPIRITNIQEEVET